MRAVKTLFEELEGKGELPERFSKYLTAEIESVRSVFTAPPGWCIVESDYKTAEIRGLAFASGDKNLIRLVSEPDRSFAITKDGNEVRLYYADDAPFPPEKRKPEYLMAYWEKGKLKKQYTEDDLKRDKNGDIEHPESTDLHWSLVETMRETPREEMDKKIDRGAGKVGNFSCVDSNALVATENGPIKITEVHSGIKVWDGEEYVEHEGSVYVGDCITITHCGLTATPDHRVWDYSGNPVELGYAAYHKTPLLLDEGKKAKTGTLCKGMLHDDAPPPSPSFRELRMAGIKLTRLPVYDLIHCGPRKRFVANGVLVSNCAYGASELSVERKVEADTGVKPEPGTGAAILAALAKRQPVATQFLEELQELPKTQPYIQLQSGRRRHFLGTTERRMKNRDWDAMMSAQGREARNIVLRLR